MYKMDFSIRNNAYPKSLFLPLHELAVSLLWRNEDLFWLDFISSPTRLCASSPSLMTAVTYIWSWHGKLVYAPTNCQQSSAAKPCTAQTMGLGRLRNHVSLIHF